ncbi:hypothetical protein MSG28_011753 [Choristoneura fumiferana]|uniref:Uncharacterized protein n=1 Tax=Choristoneura fumiferana TaxID=7141 RepID=A0ACC0KMC0_CHOFU|nr:hypothetical protein MSG28_011753 [Choristoneura fumiferana]
MVLRALLQDYMDHMHTHVAAHAEGGYSSADSAKENMVLNHNLNRFFNTADLPPPVGTTLLKSDQIDFDIKQSWISYTIYNSRTAGQIVMIFDVWIVEFVSAPNSRIGGEERSRGNILGGQGRSLLSGALANTLSQRLRAKKRVMNRSLDIMGRLAFGGLEIEGSNCH